MRPLKLKSMLSSDTAFLLGFLKCIPIELKIKSEFLCIKADNIKKPEHLAHSLHLCKYKPLNCCAEISWFVPFWSRVSLIMFNYSAY